MIRFNEFVMLNNDYAKYELVDTVQMGEQLNYKPYVYAVYDDSNESFVYTSQDAIDNFMSARGMSTVDRNRTRNPEVVGFEIPGNGKRIITYVR